MADKTQIIHLSDLHVGYRDCGGKAEQIVKKIIEHEDPINSIIIITGDIVEQGCYPQFER